MIKNKNYKKLRYKINNSFFFKQKFDTSRQNSTKIRCIFYLCILLNKTYADNFFSTKLKIL